MLLDKIKSASFIQLEASLQAKTSTLLLLGLVLLVAAEASRYFTLPDPSLSALWPPAGIFLASLLVLGWRALGVLVPVMLVWSLFWQQASGFFAFSFVAGLTLGSALAALLIQKIGRNQVKKISLKFLLSLYLQGALVGSGLAALLGAIGFWVTLAADQSLAFFDVWMVYWAFEAMGVVLFTPLALLVLLKGKRFFVKVWIDFRRFELQVWLLLSLTAAVVTLVLGSAGHSIYATAFAYSFFPLLSWLVMTARAETSFLTLPIFAALFVAFALLGWGGVQLVDDVQSLVRLLLQVAAMVILAQLIIGINAERNRLTHLFKRQAREDYLTGLDNERELNRDLQKRLERLEKPASGALPWLVYIDVLDFEEIGDLLGFEATHQLEQQIAHQLQVLRQPDEQLARLGPGRYAMTLGYRTAEEIELLLAATYHAVNDQEFASEKQATRIRAALGALPLDGALDAPAHYLSAAHQASLMARQGADRVHLATGSQSLVAKRQELTQRFEALKRALPENRLQLYAQRIKPLQQDSEQLSFEILLRMQTTDGETLSPALFLPAAETFGFMLEIDQWVIRNTLQTLADNPLWLAKTDHCGINLSGASLSDAGLVDFIRFQLDTSCVPASKLSFEVTETESIRDADLAARLISELRSLGANVALDDFGTGLASFDYLRSYEFDFLKIDGVFIRNLQTSTTDQIMVKAICEVAQSMGLSTIAEFVEGEALVTKLQELGVSYAQGFGVGRPVPIADFFAQHQIQPGSQDS